MLKQSKTSSVARELVPASFCLYKGSFLSLSPFIRLCVHTDADTLATINYSLAGIFVSTLNIKNKTKHTHTERERERERARELKGERERAKYCN